MVEPDEAGMELGGSGFSAAELEVIRRDFPILQRIGRGGNPIAYLDASATSQKPASVIAAERQFYEQHNGAVHRNAHVLGDESTQIFEDARIQLASFVGANRPEEIVWTKNATEALNLVAYAIGNASVAPAGEYPDALKLKTGDKVVVTRAEHHANLVPWQQLCHRTGATLDWLDLQPDGRLDLATLERIDERTKIVAFTHTSNVTGEITPVKTIVVAARVVGALVVLDTCQSSAHLPVNVQELGVDCAVFSSHKMLGPTGVGALWAKSALLEAWPPFLTGGSVVADVSLEKTEFLPPPQKFEAGSQPIGQIAGWAAALEYLGHLGMERVAAHERALSRQVLAGITQIPGVRLLGPAQSENRVGVFAFAVEGVHPHDVGQVLDSYDVAVRVGHHCAIPLHKFFGVRSSSRASLSVTTTAEEVERFLEALSRVHAYFSGGKAQ